MRIITHPEFFVPIQRWLIVGRTTIVKVQEQAGQACEASGARCNARRAEDASAHHGAVHGIGFEIMDAGCKVDPARSPRPCT
eukprot:366116-Chlamydomonas_euryale.AAC.6